MKSSLLVTQDVSPVELARCLRIPEWLSLPNGWQDWPSVIEAHQILARDVIAKGAHSAIGDGDGRGVVICAGGARLFPCGWVAAKMLRHVGCRLPIQFWHYPGEIDDAMRDLVAPLGVACIDAKRVELDLGAESPLVRPLGGGWELKVFALSLCPYREVLLLDADNVPVIDPTNLFDDPEYLETGAMFWPDYGRLARSRSIWEVAEVEYRDEPEVESGQVLIDRARCKKELSLALHYNDFSDFYYHHVHGDKETFHMAWRRLDRRYTMPSRGIHGLDATMCQHDRAGRRVFQHRNMDKWRLDGSNRSIPGFWAEDVCRQFLAELAARWHGRPFWSPPSGDPEGQAIMVTGKRWEYRRIGYDRRPMELLSDGTIGEGSAGCERCWHIGTFHDRTCLTFTGDDGPICHLVWNEERGLWEGHWTQHECMPIELEPIAS